MPGIGTAIGGVLGALGDTFMGGGGAGGGGGGPTSAQSAVYGSGLDGSNWNVNFSGLLSASSNSDKTGSGGGLATGLAGESISSIPWPVWAALGLLVVWKLSKSK